MSVSVRLIYDEFNFYMSWEIINYFIPVCLKIIIRENDDGTYYN